jgi:hypothetical protein
MDPLPKMLNTGADIIAHRKSVLDHLGQSRTFLKTLLDFGMAASEVSAWQL